MNDHYQCPSGGVIAAGRTRWPNALLDLVAAAPADSWILGNTNTFSSVLPGDDYTTMFGTGVGIPQQIIRAWSSFAWDDKNHRVICFGGGHANYGGNEILFMDARSLLWKLAYYSSDVVTNATGHQTIDGPLHSPISSHTYSNNNYLPKLDRFITFGGAAHSSGGPMIVTDAGGNTLRIVGGGYTLDMSQACQGKVGGVTGSNVKRNTTAGVDLPGANAWYCRDYVLNHPSASLVSSEMAKHIDSFTCYREEGGKDVLYVAAVTGGGTNPALFRIEYSDANNYLTDVVTKVGRAWDNAGTDAGGSLDTDKNIIAYLGNATYPIFGWDLNYAGGGNNNFRVQPAGLTGSGAAAFLAIGVADMGLLYDEVRHRYVAWSRGGQLWSIETPSGSPVPTTGWVVTEISNPSSPRPWTSAEMGAVTPYGENDSGVHGKWKRSKSLDLYVGLQGAISGNVWFYKPSGWTDPRT